MPTAPPPKVDFKKTLPSYRARKGNIDLITVPPLRYLAVDALGSPDAPASAPHSFAHTVETLYPLAFAIKFASKTQAGRDYVVPPLEALWWADDMTAFTTSADKNAWKSTALLMLPDWVTDDLIAAGRDKAARKVADDALATVRVESLDEGQCAQTLHVGPFSAEGPTIESLHAHIADAGLALAGKHHEIYLSDFRRVAPEKLRTILRQPAR